MKKISNKGFTLVELLAMLTVLGILMVITIPNISKILENSRMNQVKMDARKMVDSAKVKMAKSNFDKNQDDGNTIYVFSLDYLDTNEDIKKGPNGGNYDQYSSFLAYKKVEGIPEYYVRLIEKKGNTYYVMANEGKELVKIDDITKKDSTIKFDKKSSIEEMKKEYYDDDLESNPLKDYISASGVDAFIEKPDFQFVYFAGDISCPDGAYRGVASVDDAGKPCTEGDNCKPRITCICYNTDEMYDSVNGKCIKKS